MPDTAPSPASPGEPASLKKDAIGFGSALVIGLASTAPAYSLAAVIGILVLEVGVQTPAILLVSFIPMLFIATAYYLMNRADPDPGTTFAWATRALGPTTGWLAGWAIMTAGVIVIGLLANTASTYTYLLFDWQSAADSKEAVIALAVVMIAVLTYICVIGIELSARTQVVMMCAQLGALAIFALVALGKVLFGDGGPTSVDPELSWFSPFAIDGTSALTAGVLIGIFVYWGWDSAVSVNEETEDPASAPGRAAVVSTLILLGIYLLVAVACVAWLGVEKLGAFEDETAFDAIAGQVFSSPFDKLVALAVLTSSLAATQTTVLPSSRTALSMARHGAAPESLAGVHPEYRSPAQATIVVGVAAVVFYVLFNYLSSAFYESSLSALGLLICINYGVNGLACVLYYRRQATRSAKDLLTMLVMPLLGALLFGAVFVKSVVDFTETGVEDTTYWFGLQSPLVVTIGLFVVAAILIAIWRGTGHSRFFERRPETAE